MPEAIWGLIPADRTIYWRVRGADLKTTPLAIVTSDEIW